MEVITWTQLGIHNKRLFLLLLSFAHLHPRYIVHTAVVLVNVLGFFGPLRSLIQRAISEGFIRPHNEQLVVFVDGPADLSEHQTFDWGSAALAALDGWTRSGNALFDWTVRENGGKSAGGLEAS